MAKKPNLNLTKAAIIRALKAEMIHHAKVNLDFYGLRRAIAIIKKL